MRIASRVEERKENFIDRLVHDAHHAQNEQRQRIAQHLSQHRPRKIILFVHNGRQQTERLNGGGEDIRHKHIAHAVVGLDRTTKRVRASTP